MKRILVAIDASPRAPAVLAAAAELARIADAKLVVYRAVGVSPDLPREMLSVSDSTLEEIMLRNAREDLRRFAKDVPPERIDKLVASFATAWDGICRTASDEDVELVVIGSHGYSGLDRILGTTASKVVNHCDRNVLVVRAPLQVTR
jgi:nucleotide-binding universal stress UspA family protein